MIHPVNLTVNGLSQPLPPTWSPYGPREKILNITMYSDIQNEYTAFLSGKVDITDFPLLPSQQPPTFCAGDIFCTPAQTALQLFDLEVNHHNSFLGVSLQAARTVAPPTLVLPASTAAGICGTGLGQLTVNLQNQEQANAPVLDSLNKLTITSQPSVTSSATATDSGGSQPTGTYVFPCVVAGTYKISSSVYDSTAPCSSTQPTSCAFIGSNQAVTVTLRVNWNSPSTVEPTQAGVYIPRALAHLLDKPSFAANSPLSGRGIYDDEWTSPAQNLPNNFPVTAECVDHPWFNPCSPVSAYNFVSDSLGGGSEWWTQPGTSAGVSLGYSGVADLRAACDDFVRAGFVVVGGANSTDCGSVALASQGSTAPSGYAHLSNNGHQIFVILRSDAVRKAYGQIIADSINFLFGTPNNGQTFPNQTPQCTVTYGGPGCNTYYLGLSTILSCVFETPILSALDGCPAPWNLYTAGYGLDAFADQLFVYAYSSSASGVCGGSPEHYFANYFFYCDPQFDTDANAGEFSPTSAQAYQFFARAAVTGALNGLPLPVYTPIGVYSALAGWDTQTACGCASSQSSLVPVLGNGFAAGSGYWSFLNMRQIPGFVPSNPAYKPGGGNPDLIRRGFSQDIDSLSPFNAYSPQDLEVISLIYDSLLQPNPLTLGTDGQFMDWQTLAHTSVYSPSEVSCNSLNGCVTGTTTTIWHLRSDLMFQDGTRLTADDVVYTILAYRDVPSGYFQYNVLPVSSAVALNPTTIQVKLQGNAFNAVTNLGSIPIIPAHIWEPICGPIVNGTIPSGPSSNCANPTFDPMSQGIMIGDGPWQCVVPSGFPNAGHVGGSCNILGGCQPPAQCLGGQTATFPGYIILNRYGGYLRCCPDDTSSSLYKFSWADKFNEGRVTIRDIADVALHWQQTDPYWVNSNIAPGNTVNIQDLSVVALYWQVGITGTIPWQQMKGIDPQIDPFFCPNTGC